MQPQLPLPWSLQPSLCPEPQCSPECVGAEGCTRGLTSELRRAVANRGNSLYLYHSHTHTSMHTDTAHTHMPHAHTCTHIHRLTNSQMAGCGGAKGAWALGLFPPAEEPGLVRTAAEQGPERSSNIVQLSPRLSTTSAAFCGQSKSQSPPDAKGVSRPLLLTGCQ